MKRKTILLLVVSVASVFTGSSEEKLSSAPGQDRVGFPADYARTYDVLRVVNKPDEQKMVTVYGNRKAASITNSNQLPYPYGSIIVMETASTTKDTQGKLLADQNANLRKDRVTGLHVMRRELGFGEAYGDNRAGEWEFVEYKPDGTYITPPQKSGTCAACHVKAGQKLDFVYRGRLIESKLK